LIDLIFWQNTMLHVRSDGLRTLTLLARWAQQSVKTPMVSWSAVATGMGVGIMSNKAISWSAGSNGRKYDGRARYSRADNDANILCLVRQPITGEEKAKELVDAFLEQESNTYPKIEDGQPAPWWNKNVEALLSTSKEGIERVEKEAMNTI
jgi:hypothetical protein